MAITLVAVPLSTEQRVHVVSRQRSVTVRIVRKVGQDDFRINTWRSLPIRIHSLRISVPPMYLYPILTNAQRLSAKDTRYTEPSFER